LPIFERAQAPEVVGDASDRSLGFVACVALVVTGLWPLLHAQGPRWWAVGFGLAFGAAGLIRPSLLAPCNKVWTALGLLLGKIITPVVMAILLYGVIAPVGLIQRLLGRDQLRLKRDANVDSYWEFRRASGRPPVNMTNQF
jgi:Saxitoxin biosynthesis operon protein SxtJ